MSQLAVNDSRADQRPTHARGFGADRQSLERELERHGIALPIRHHVEWLRAEGASDALLCVARDPEGAPVAATVAAVAPSRALPGHHLYRVERFSSSSDAADDALLSTLADAARRDRRCLRLSVELFERDAGRRNRLGETLGALGFVREAVPRNYRRTVSMELTSGEAALFAGLAGKVRRDVRAPVKKGLVVRSVEDPALAPRLDALMNETYARTGGHAPPMPWSTIIELSGRYPERSRVSGLFDPNTPGLDSIVAFAWGAVHGRCATYEAGASTRRPDLSKVPIAYSTLWDVMAWSCSTHATWFDLGGITEGEPGSDPLAGISAFKRYFSDEIVDVGEEWTLEPRLVTGAIARAVSAMARRVRSR